MGIKPNWRLPQGVNFLRGVIGGYNSHFIQHTIHGSIVFKGVSVISENLGEVCVIMSKLIGDLCKFSFFNC